MEIAKDVTSIEKRNFERRVKFLKIYTDFDKWLINTLYFKDTHINGVRDYNYSHYKKYIESLYGVEHYKQDSIRLSLIFIRDRHEHKFMFIGEMGSISKVYTINKFKKLIIEDVKRLRDEKLKELDKISMI